MFSASLISMIFHSLDPEARGRFANSVTYSTPQDIANALATLLRLFPNSGRRRIPAVGRTRRPIDKLGKYLQSSFEFSSGDPFSFFWGRIPLSLLVDLIGDSHAKMADEEYVDLGTPLIRSAAGSVHDKTCARLMPLTANAPSSRSGNTARVGAAIIDMGDASGHAPRDYGGKLRHVVTGNIEISDHAEKVLAVLLERLQTKAVIGNTTVSCALVRRPAAHLHVGRTCFEQSCATEMLDAVKLLEPQLTSDGIPAAINMSLGTHVGPHNGESPLEEFVSTTLTKSDRFVIAAAGNEGRSGGAAKCDLVAKEADFLTIRTGGVRCEEVLAEFWWDDSGGAALAIQADIWEIQPNGTRINHARVPITSTISGTTLTTVPAGLPAGMLMHSLFNATARSNYGCVALAISSPSGTPLPQMQIDIKLEAGRDVIVNGWMVITEENPLSCFVGGGPDGTVTVPASDPAVLSVAGLDRAGQMWAGSSRGPASQYDSAKPGTNSPMMAHLANLGSDVGTSFASPRACGDAVATLANSSKLPLCVDTQTLLQQTYGLPNPLPPWNSRSGFHKQST